MKYQEKQLSIMFLILFEMFISCEEAKKKRQFWVQTLLIYIFIQCFVGIFSITKTFSKLYGWMGHQSWTRTNLQWVRQGQGVNLLLFPCFPVYFGNILLYFH